MTPWRSENRDSACKNCKERYVGCHSACGRYKPTDYDFGRHKSEREYLDYLVETRRRFGKK